MSRPPRCDKPADGSACGAILKPDVVFFDEMIPPEAIAGAAELVRGADLIMVVGTSCEVYPASEIPHQVRGQGGRIIEINLEQAGGLKPDLSLPGKFSVIVPQLKENWLRFRALASGPPSSKAP